MVIKKPKSQWQTQRRNRHKRVPKNQKTRKGHSDDDDLDDDYAYHYYDMDEILQYLQHGGVSGVYARLAARSPVRTKTKQIIHKLIQYGWEKAHITALLERMTDRFLPHGNDELYMEDLMKAFAHQLGHKGEIYDSLRSLGVRDVVAREVEHVLEPLEDTCYTESQLLDIAIEYLTGKYKPITPPTTTHPIEPSQTNVWIPYKHYDKSLFVYNISHRCNTAQASQQFANALRTLPRTTDSPSDIRFHSTSWGSAYSIMDAINHDVGRKCLDFGLRPGFYMSTTPEDCINWCIYNADCWSNETAIFIFQIPNPFPTDIRIKYIEGEEWTAITKESRMCSNPIPALESRALRGYDLLYGNMVRNTYNTRMGLNVPKTHHPPKKQLVGKTEKADEFLHRCLVGCVFFQKYITT